MISHSTLQGWICIESKNESLYFSQWQALADSWWRTLYCYYVTCKRSSDTISSISPTLWAMQPDCYRYRHAVYKAALHTSNQHVRCVMSVLVDVSHFPVIALFYFCMFSPVNKCHMWAPSLLGLSNSWHSPYPDRTVPQGSGPHSAWAWSLRPDGSLKNPVLHADRRGGEGAEGPWRAKEGYSVWNWGSGLYCGESRASF